LLVALALAFGATPAAMSASLEGGAFNELSNRANRETTPTQTTTTAASTESTSSYNSGTLIVLASVVAVVLLAGIAFAILRDAHKVAPAGDAQLAEATASRRPVTRFRKRRARAKAAKRQRKRNR